MLAGFQVLPAGRVLYAIVSKALGSGCRNTGERFRVNATRSCNMMRVVILFFVLPVFLVFRVG